MSDLSMIVADITTEKASGEVSTFDFRTNMVCGQKLTAEDALGILDRAKELTELEGMTATQIGFYLLALKEHANFNDIGCKNLEEVAKKFLGIAKGPAYEKLKVAIRFRDTENVNHYGLDSRFAGYKFSSLLALAKANVSNEDIEKLGINKDMTYLEVAEKLNPKKEADEEAKESSDSEQKKEESSDSEQKTEENETTIEAEAKEVEMFEVDFTELKDYVKSTLRKYYKGLNKEFTGTLVITNLK